MRTPVAELILSDDGKNVLADREGMELTAYYDSVGVLTIGIGHTGAAGPPPVTEGMTITEEEAWEIFAMDNAHFREECLTLVTAPLEQWEYDATASFIFNIGTTQFSTSTFLELVNDEQYERAADALLWWDQPSEIIPRRRGEYVQFKDGIYVARVSDEAWNAGVPT